MFDRNGISKGFEKAIVKKEDRYSFFAVAQDYCPTAHCFRNAFVAAKQSKW